MVDKLYYKIISVKFQVILAVSNSQFFVCYFCCIFCDLCQHLQEKKIEVLESDFDQSQNDLQLAFKRIADLQAVIEDDVDAYEDSDDLDRSVTLASSVVFNVPLFNSKPYWCFWAYLLAISSIWWPSVFLHYSFTSSGITISAIQFYLA